MNRRNSRRIECGICFREQTADSFALESDRRTRTIERWEVITNAAEELGRAVTHETDGSKTVG